MTIDCHVDGRALTFFECEMLEDYAEQIEHGEGIALSEIIESGFEVIEGGFEPLTDDEINLTRLDDLWEQMAEAEFEPSYPCAMCNGFHVGLCEAEEEWIEQHQQ